MDYKLAKEIDDIVKELVPPPKSVGLLLIEDVQRIVSIAAERGAIAGWVHGMRTAANVAKQARDAK